jgi:aryl-alcohol dehydrogenase-like predicted oxidoreductase
VALVNLRLMSREARAGIPMGEHLGALKTLEDEGKIESIGPSNASVDEVTAALETVDLGEVQHASVRASMPAVP